MLLTMGDITHHPRVCPPSPLLRGVAVRELESRGGGGMGACDVAVDGDDGQPLPAIQEEDRRERGPCSRVALGMNGKCASL